ncbi:unnamed protein product [Urochloa humidicola]
MSPRSFVASSSLPSHGKRLFMRGEATRPRPGPDSFLTHLIVPAMDLDLPPPNLALGRDQPTSVESVPSSVTRRGGPRRWSTRHRHQTLHKSHRWPAALEVHLRHYTTHSCCQGRQLLLRSVVGSRSPTIGVDDTYSLHLGVFLINPTSPTVSFNKGVSLLIQPQLMQRGPSARLLNCPAIPDPVTANLAGVELTFGCQAAVVIRDTCSACKPVTRSSVCVRVKGFCVCLLPLWSAVFNTLCRGAYVSL